MRNILIILLVANAWICNSQSIRKDYREMTGAEMQDYTIALNTISAEVSHFASHHAIHFSTPIHSFGGTGEWFTTWHRVFLLDFEFELRKSSQGASYLALPYWNWLEDTDKTNPNFWNNTFLSLPNLASYTSLGLTRGSLSGPPLPNPAGLNTVLSIPTFYTFGDNSTFSKQLESNYHNTVHGWVGGTMGVGNSPLDPVFFLHHNMVDYIWQQWEDKNTGIQSNFPNGTTPMPGYRVIEPNHAPYPCNIIANTQKDSRSIARPFSGGGCSSMRNWDVWFASNKKVVLDGANGTPFVCSEISENYLYRYVAAVTPGSATVEGEMFVGDVKRDNLNNILVDNNGGFEVNSGVTANFSAGKSIVFMPGFVSKSGSNLNAKIISAANLARQINSVTNEIALISDKKVSNLKLYPNPSNSIIAIISEEYKIKNVTISRTIDSRIIFNKQVDNQSDIEIDVSYFEKGIYIVSIERTNGITTTEKLIKN